MAARRMVGDEHADFSGRREAAKDLLGAQGFDPDSTALGRADETKSFAFTLAAGSTVNMFRGNEGYDSQRTFLVSAATSQCQLLITELFDRATMVRTVQIPHNNRLMLTVNGSAQVDIQNTGVGVAAINWAYVTQADIAPVPPIQTVVTGLVQGALGVPGTWTDMGIAGADDRTSMQVYSLGAVDVHFKDIAGTERAFFTLNGASDELVIPPHCIPEVRHPGGAGDTRGCVVVYRRS